MENYIEFPGVGLKFALDRIAFKIGSVEIYWYAVIIALGLTLAIFYAYFNAKKFKVDKDSLLDCAIWGCVAGIIGARLYYVIFNFGVYKDNLLNIFNLRDGGLAIYGAVIAGLGVGALVAKFKKVNVLSLLDLGGIGFLIGQAVGRWGNFFNQETFGANTTLPWGMTGSQIKESLELNKNVLDLKGINIDPNLPVHPCFLYESIWCIIGFIFLHILSKKRKFNGQIFLLYIGWYGLGRFFIEGLRTDSLMIGPFRISQLVAAACVIVSIGLYYLLLRRKKFLDSLEASGVDISDINVNIFNLKSASAVGIIGGADGPTSIFISKKNKPDMDLINEVNSVNEEKEDSIESENDEENNS